MVSGAVALMMAFRAMPNGIAAPNDFSATADHKGTVIHFRFPEHRTGWGMSNRALAAWPGR